MGFKEMLAEANAAIETISVDEALGLVGNADVTFVDVRETVELQQSGKVAGAIHAPRGFLEFQADSESPSHNPVFSSGNRLVLYCGSGGRSALAGKTLVDMGIGKVCHVGGGFAAWQQAGGPLDT